MPDAEHRSANPYVTGVRERLQQTTRAVHPVIQRLGPRRLAAGSALIVVAAILLLQCGADVHAGPAISDHLPGHNANAPANQTSGTCKMFTTQQIQTAFAGQASAPNADNLTAGLDRCTWTIRKSALASKPFELAAYRPLDARAIGKPVKGQGLVPVPTLGAGADYDARNLTVTYIRDGAPISLQLITMSNTKIGPGRAQAALVTLARNH